MSTDQNVADIEQQISRLIPVEKFLRIQERLAELRNEEEDKLKALADLQKSYLAANSDPERELVKTTVGKIRELSKITRTEIRELNQQLTEHMSLQQATQLYQQLLEAQSQRPK